MTLANYLLDHYGQCLIESTTGCRCIADSFKGFLWEGRGCPHWQSFGAKTWEELKQIQEITNATSK